MQKYKVNNNIKSPKVRLIDINGQQLGIKTIQEALNLADIKNLDLIEINSKIIPPVCKLTDYDKFLYERKKKEKEIKRNQNNQKIKEIQLGCKTEKHDVDFKLKQARCFLENGNKLKIIVKFKGREFNYIDIGQKLLDTFINGLEDIAKIEVSPKMEGKNLIAYLVKK